MRQLVVLAAIAGLAMAKPGTYREKEDFQYSRSSSDQGTKSGYYGAQRGNMGGNYEKAHNMDSVAQNQMSGLVRSVQGELGDGLNQPTGSVYTAANSKGIYGSGANFDLSNLSGRNFQEGTSFSNSQSASSSPSSASTQNSAYRNQYSNNGAYNSAQSLNAGFDSTRAHDGGYASTLSRNQGYNTNGYSQGQGYSRQSSSANSNQATYLNSQQTSNLQSENQFQDRNTEQLQTGGYQGQVYEKGNSQSQSNIRSRIVSGTPVKVIIRPGTQVSVPVGAQTYITPYNSSPLNQNTVSRVVSKPHNYESSYSYKKEWEKQDSQPVVGVSVYPKNSELYEDSQSYLEEQQRLNALSSQSQSSRLSGYNVNSASSNQYNTKQQRTDVNSGYQSGYGHGASDSSYQGSNSASSLNVIDGSNTKPKSYQSSYSYHKSWEHQGDPYVILPKDDPTAESLNLGNYGSSQQYGSQSQQHSQQSYSKGYSSNNCDNKCHIRKARSYNLDQVEDLGQQTQVAWQELGQQSQNSRDQVGQQAQELEDFGQQTQDSWDQVGQQAQDKLEDFGQQTQDSWDQVGQQAQDKLADFGQQTQDSWDQVGQQAQDKLVDFGQQTQDSWDQVGQQAQDKLVDFGQQTQDSWNQKSEQAQDKLEDFGQQTQNSWDQLGQQAQNKLVDFGQQTQDSWDQVGQKAQDKLEDFGQQTQNIWNNQELQSQNNEGQQTQDLWTAQGTHSNEKTEQNSASTNISSHGMGINQQSSDKTFEIMSANNHFKHDIELAEKNKTHNYFHTFWDVIKREETGQENENTMEDLSQTADLGQQTQVTWDKYHQENQPWNLATEDNKNLVPTTPKPNQQDTSDILNSHPWTHIHHNNETGSNKFFAHQSSSSYNRSHSHSWLEDSGNTNKLQSSSNESRRTINSLWDTLGGFEQLPSFNSGSVKNKTTANAFGDHGNHGGIQIQNQFKNNDNNLTKSTTTKPTTDKINIPIPSEIGRGDIGPENSNEEGESDDSGRGDIESEISHHRNPGSLVTQDKNENEKDLRVITIEEQQKSNKHLIGHKDNETITRSTQRNNRNLYNAGKDVQSDVEKYHKQDQENLDQHTFNNEFQFGQGTEQQKNTDQQIYNFEQKSENFGFHQMDNQYTHQTQNLHQGKFEDLSQHTQQTQNLHQEQFQDFNQHTQQTQNLHQGQFEDLSQQSQFHILTKPNMAQSQKEDMETQHLQQQSQTGWTEVMEDQQLQTAWKPTEDLQQQSQVTFDVPIEHLHYSFYQGKNEQQQSEDFHTIGWESQDVQQQSPSDQLKETMENYEQQVQKAREPSEEFQQHSKHADTISQMQQNNPKTEVVEEIIVPKKATDVLTPQEVTEKPGIWKSIGNKFTSAKDTVYSWFSGGSK